MEKCFADIAPHRCTALKVKECKGCKFFKTQKQFDEDRKKADENGVRGRMGRKE